MDVIMQALAYLNMNEQKVDFDDIRQAHINRKELLKKRENVICSKCQLFYKCHPMIVTRASMQYVYDEVGREYLDCISNVQHVGHCNPKVVAAISKQLALSTCNSRFVSSKLVDCAERLLKTLPGLDTVLFCNSGSEANDLALRLARDFTGQNDVIVMDHAYHGHVTTTMQMSPYKFDHGCTIQKPDWVHVAPCPDVYRGQYRVNDEELFDEKKLTAVGKHYSSDVRQIIEQARLHGRSVGAFIAEALQSCGGQIIPPPEYFDDVAKYVRDHGGVVIIDEVQTGFGRVGSTFWAYQLFSKNFVPDIVTMGKPMGNGFPVAAVVTRKEIADKLGGDVGYFNTYGGNPVACTAVIAVLDVIDSESLSEHSQRMGHIFKKELEELKQKHTSIGDIRGVGLFWGIDLVDDRKTRMPATKLANEVINMLRNDYGVLLSTDGPYANILKIKPPMCFNEDNLHKTVDAIDKCLRQLQK